MKANDLNFALSEYKRFKCWESNLKNSVGFTGVQNYIKRNIEELEKKFPHLKGLK